MSRTVKVPCCDAAGENTSPRTGGSNHPGLAKGAKPLRLHINTSKGFFTAQVLYSWASRTVLFVERTTRSMSMGKRGKQAARSVAAVWPCGLCVAAVWQPVNSWSISRACLRLNTQATTNFSKPHPKVLAPFVLRLIFAQLRMKQDYWRKYHLIVGRLLSPTIVVSLRRPVSVEQADR